MENNGNEKNKKNDAIIKEKARKSITPTNKSKKKEVSTTKKNSSSSSSESISFEDVPKRSQVKGLPKKDLKVFESKSTSYDSNNDKKINKVKSNSQKKSSTKEKTVSLSKCKGTEFLNSQYNKNKENEQLINKSTQNNKSNDVKTNTTKSISNERKTTNNRTKSLKTEQTNNKAIISKDLDNKDNSASNENKTQKSNKKKTNKTKTSTKSNKKDANRPLNREKSRPTERKPKQKASQNIPIASNKKDNNISKNTIIVEKPKEVREVKNKKNQSEESQLNKLRSFIEKNKSIDPRKEIDTNRNRARALTKKQLEKNAIKNQVHKSFSFKLFNLFPKIPLHLKLIYLLIITIILIVFFSVNYIIKDNDFFVENDKLSALEESLNLDEKIDNIVSSNNLEYVEEIISPITSSNSVINFTDIEQSDDYIKINIERGLSATQIATLLQEANLCSKDDFLDFVVSNDLASNLRSGEYYIEKNSSVEDIVNTIIEADPSIIIIYPAKTIDQVDLLLTNKGLINRGDFDKACVDLCESKGFDFVEGWFAPATYKISNEFDVNLLATSMFESTMSIIAPHTKTIAQNGYSINDIIIIASLIQAETQDVNQMPIISSIIHNRLDLDMPLGIDATTRYELGDWISELTSEQLNTITPYNTRRQKGLPPSGICLSSKDAILSAIFPNDTNYLYYIHEKDGSLTPALTYEEHLANIDKRDNN